MSVNVQAPLRFALVGLSNTAVGFLAICVALKYLRFGDIAANITGYAIGYVWSFWLNRRWTFGHQGDVRGSMFRYAMVCLASYAVNLLVLLAAGLYLGQRSLMAQGLGMLSYTLLCYTGSRIFAFPVQPAEGAKR